MTDILTADDPLYERLYDVRREAAEIGNLVEEDMNPKMNALRESAPVQKGFLRELLGLPEHHRHVGAAGREAYTCFSWEACDAAFRNHETFSQQLYRAGPGGDPGAMRMGILEMDEPDHLAYRATLQPMFGKPKTLTWWRQRWINDIVGALVERLERKDRAELNIEFCARIPVHTVTRAMGMDGDNSLTFRKALLRNTMSDATPAERVEAGAAVERMLLELVAERRAAPKDDIISGMTKAELVLPDGTRRPLTDREIMINARIVMLAGGGTSWRQCGITLWALLTNPEQLAAVRADRSLLEDAIEESVRWNPTDPVFDRLVMHDTELGGVTVPAGSVLEICLGAANRDPRRWDRPDDYDLHRPIQNHLGFGMGTHQCMGMNVARSEIFVGVSALLDAFPNLRLDRDEPEPFLTGGLEQRGISGLNVLLR
jgi:cytochrome P450